MKIVLNSESNDFLHEFSSIAIENDKTDVIESKTERILFDEIGKENADAFILQSHKTYTQRAIDFIKRKTPYIPVIAMITIKKDSDIKWPQGADFYIFNTGLEIPVKDFYKATARTIQSYNTNFDKLKRITAKVRDELSFGDCRYNPARRTFHYQDKLVNKMSPKEGGVLEILAANYGSVVRKEIILEKVWHKSHFWVGRSMDVYLTNLRKLFREK